MQVMACLTMYASISCFLLQVLHESYFDMYPNMGLVSALFILFRIYFPLSRSNVDIVALYNSTLNIMVTGDMLKLCIFITPLINKPHAIGHLKKDPGMYFRLGMHNCIA